MDDIKDRSLKYLYKKIKQTRISLSRAEQKPNAGNEIAGLKNKIEVLEWLSDLALNAQKGD